MFCFSTVLCQTSLLFFDEKNKCVFWWYVIVFGHALGVKPSVFLAISKNVAFQVHHKSYKPTDSVWFTTLDWNSIAHEFLHRSSKRWELAFLKYLLKHISKVILNISLHCSRTPLNEWSARRRALHNVTHNTHSRQTSMPTAGIKAATPASERPQTHALDRAPIKNKTGNVRVT